MHYIFRLTYVYELEFFLSWNMLNMCNVQRQRRNKSHSDAGRGMKELDTERQIDIEKKRR